MTKAMRHDRVAGSLLAGALGDAAGYLVEFSSLEEIRRNYGPSGLTLVALGDQESLVVSDDTQMTLFTLEGILRAVEAGAVELESVEQHVREAYLDWYGTQVRTDRVPTGKLASNRVLQHRRAPGLTCMAALKAGGNSWAALPGRRLNDSKGCGTVMRTAPIGWFGHWSAEEAFEIGVRASAITHNHPTGYIAGGAMAAIVHFLMEGASLNDAALQARQLAAAWPGHDETVIAIDLALHLANSSRIPGPEVIAEMGEGWVAEEALAIGLYAAIRGETVTEALELAINHSGDSDSTASIAGQLRGAVEGLRGMSLDRVHNLDVIELANKLIDTAFDSK